MQPNNSIFTESVDFIKVDSGRFNITTDFAVNGWSESKDMRCDKPILLA